MASNGLAWYDCVCVESCADDPKTACSLPREPHVHPDTGSGTFGPCPVHPDALAQSKRSGTTLTLSSKSAGGQVGASSR